MSDDHMNQNILPNKEAVSKLIDIGSMVPLVLTLSSYDNSFIKMSQDVNGITNVIIHEMADNWYTGIMCICRWLDSGMDTYDAAGRDDVPWPDVNMESAREEAPEMNHVFDYALQLFSNVRTMDVSDMVMDMYNTWQRYTEDERSALMFTVLMSVANTMYTAVQTVGMSQIQSFLEAKIKLMDVENPEDLLK